MAQKAIVVGGAGALGRAVVSRFARAGWGTTSIDFTSNDEASTSLQLCDNSPWTKQAAKLSEQLKDTNADFIFCAAGGWAGGTVASPDGLDSIDQMWQMCVQSAATAAHIGSQALSPNGLLVFTGATAALTPSCTAGMIGYGMSKAATHHLVQSLGSGEDTGLPPDATVLGILPTTIDTPMNRKFMADADFSTWTPTDEIAGQLFGWSTGTIALPETGTLMVMETEENKTEWRSA
jgi:dihydropteridine reductase